VTVISTAFHYARALGDPNFRNRLRAIGAVPNAEVTVIVAEMDTPMEDVLTRAYSTGQRRVLLATGDTAAPDGLHLAWLDLEPFRALVNRR
jgi:hypothetical protein